MKYILLLLTFLLAGVCKAQSPFDTPLFRALTSAESHTEVVDINKTFKDTLLIANEEPIYLRVGSRLFLIGAQGESMRELSQPSFTQPSRKFTYHSGYTMSNSGLIQEDSEEEEALNDARVQANKTGELVLVPKYKTIVNPTSIDTFSVKPLLNKTKPKISHLNPKP